ncbi:hypothetical protein [Pleurocapsa sp. PCC 7319]|uniref:hypothetical protein n=1 Tax=Pleurocapsa sp. PCC 7319 TaxID=118161 RepID=UPI0003452345|nr:hypothetical protein [Pleurocapsa sp. PCC 7319]
MFDIIKLAKSTHSVDSLLGDDEFKSALDALAVVELKAAQDALLKSKIEKYPQSREALTQVLKHLNSAHLSFRQSWLSPVNGFIRRYKSEIQALLDARTCCLIALVQYTLGEPQELIVDSLNSAQEAIAFEEKTGVVETLFHIVNPINFIDFFWERSELKYEELFIAKSDLQEFGKVLTR